MQSSAQKGELRLSVNGVAASVGRGPDPSLLEVLRDELDVTGPKPGCGEGVCGACTVLIDGRPVRSCQTPVSAADGRDVVTIEGLADSGALHPVQQAFLDEGAFQCGYCTPGMILSAAALLAATHEPDDDAIRSGLADHICRCGTYPRILAAVRRAATAGGTPSGGLPAPPPIELDRRPRAPWDLTPTADRDWFDILPDGLVVVLEPDRSGGWSTTSGAWLHLGSDGLVTAFTGKVDAGQDNRTGLSIIVAEAVGVALERVRLVMGDTDLCPYDAGTFGSRSTPDAGRELRILGEAARGLIDEVAPGLRRVEVVERPRRAGGAPSAPAPARAGISRLTGPGIVTGAKRFPSDVVRPGMRHGVVLRSPAAGAELRAVDLGDLGDLGDGSPEITVVHEDAFMGVVAATPTQAREALAHVMAEWELPDLPADADLEAHLRANPVEDDSWEGGFHRASGDVDGALASAQVRVEATYRTAYVAHAPMETRSAVAEWGDDGRLTVWTGTQVPFGVREEVAEALGVSEASVRVIVPDFGGGFGGKHAGEVAFEAARLARAAGTPVKVRWSREDEFRHGYVRPAAVIDIRAGALRDGSLTAWQLTNVNWGTFGLAGPYAVENQRLDYQAAESPLRQGSYRGLAATANHFARESAMDELAVALEIDPLELRVSHLGDERLADVFLEAAKRIDWTRERDDAVGL